MKVKFVPQNIEVEATPDKTLLQIATEKGIEIKSICKGVPSCAECRVRIVDGEGNVLPPGKAELSLIGTSYYIDSRRLSCQVHCYGDVTVDLTEQVERLENQTKKIRGFRVSKQQESKALQDTMILSEKIEDQHHGKFHSHQSAQATEQGSGEPGAGQSSEGGKSSGSQGRQQQQNRQHQQGRQNQQGGQKQGQQNRQNQQGKNSGQQNRQNPQGQKQQQGQKQNQPQGQKQNQQNRNNNRPADQQNKQQGKPQQQQQPRPPKTDGGNEGGGDRPK